MDKLKELFSGMIVKKSESEQFASLNIPSFIRDWFIKRYSDSDGNIDGNFVAKKIKEIVPRSEDSNVILDRLIQGEEVKFLAKVEPSIDIKNNFISFSIADLGIEKKDTMITAFNWERFKSLLLGANASWGIVTLKMEQVGTKKIENKISLEDFKGFTPYQIDLEYFKKCRKQFEFDEWLDVLLGAIDYNGAAFSSNEEKLQLLTRLLPFVEKRINLIELAPKGTGKSYLFSQISKFGWLSNGGIISRAKLFYDISSRTEGLVSNYDYVALDEISSIKFPDKDEMRGAMKGYLESGTYTVGSKSGKGDAGLILLGNIKQEQMDTSIDMFSSLPEVFHESALLDRFHGFIEGWKIPRMKEDKKAKDWALNSEYFALIMHELRDDVSQRALVEKLISYDASSDTRDVTAVKRMTSAFLKLLFPHWTKTADVDKDLFEKYCLNPAINMRAIIIKQMGIIDTEFKNKSICEFKII